jgi:hypothetical protein
MNENLPPQPADEPVPALDAEKLLAGELPASAAPGVLELAGLLAELRSTARQQELSGEKGALAAFEAARGGATVFVTKEKDMLEPGNPVRRLANPRFGAKAAVAAVVCSLALGGVAAAATTGSLPGPLQSFAHVLGAPDSGDGADGTPAGSASGEPTGTPTTTPTSTASTSPSTDPSGSSPSSGQGPDAFGPAAWGLCHAFGTKTWGNPNGSGASADPAGRKPTNPSVAYGDVVAAAASKGLTVDAFCAIVLANHGAPSTWPTTQGGPNGSASGSPAPSPANGHGNGGGNGGGNGRSTHSAPGQGGGNGHGQG